MNENISSDISENIDYFNSKLRIGKSFDILCRIILIGGKTSCLYFVNGFIADETIQKMMQVFGDIKEEDMPNNYSDFLKNHIPYNSVSTVENKDDIVKMILSGITCLMIDGYKKCFAIDSRSYPQRGVQEPEKDKVLRGSKDGFVETIVANTALIRRRIRSTDLNMIILNAGVSSKTDIVVSYMENRANPEFVNEVIRRIKNIKVDSLTMNQESLAECLYHGKWINPFPKFKFSERPDTAAASILEGDIVILVDNSPAAMILPATVFDIIEDADDYYFPPVTGTYLRLSRFIINILALLISPTWLMFMHHQSLIPPWLEFIKVQDVVNVPLILQFLILEFSIDGLKLAALNTPSMLSTPLSVIAALVLSDFTVSSGWFNSEVMLYMAFVAIANYTQSSYELGYALKFMRIIILILTNFFGIWGYALGIIFTIFCIVKNKTISGKSYIYPLIPLNKKQLIKRVFRVNLLNDDREKNYNN